MLRNTLKKGELTFNQIVVAAIALVVLIIVIIIVSGNLGGQSYTVNSCSINQGTCIEANENCNNGYIRPGNYSDCFEPKRCCVKLFVSNE